MIRPHWTTEIRRAVTKHFAAVAESEGMHMFLGEDQKRPNSHSKWAELKVYGPFYSEEADGQTTTVRLQIRVGCAINIQRSENIYEITDLLGLFAAAASENILVTGITSPDFCLHDMNIRTIERGNVETKIPLKVGYMEVDLTGIIEHERMIEA